jgi:hypothetical protein
MPDLKRLPAGDLIIDLRPASPAEVEDASVFDDLMPRLAGMEARVRLRVWVLHDAAAQWCSDPAVLQHSILKWLTAAHSQSLTADGSDAVVLPPAAIREPRLVGAIQALGLAVYRTRHGGGLPLETVHLEGRQYTAFTTTPLPTVVLEPALQQAVLRALG